MIDIDELERIIKAGDRYGHVTPGRVLELIAELRQLRADLAAANLRADGNAVDAERYRWLKAHWGRRTPILNGLVPKGLEDDAFDAGIDSARAAGEKA
jgi:hypothetical protein